jgi:DNA-binding beta-propeller fold protein YncE
VATKGNIFVTNSNRFSAGSDQNVAVLDAQNPLASQIVIPAGEFPRELKVTADENTLLITNFASQSLELVDLTRILSH